LPEGEHMIIQKIDLSLLRKL